MDYEYGPLEGQPSLEELQTQFEQGFDLFKQLVLRARRLRYHLMRAFSRSFIEPSIGILQRETRSAISSYRFRSANGQETRPTG